MHEVCAHPRRYQAFDPPVRRILAHGFPYAVLYVGQDDRVWIVAIMHLKRRPGYWKHRLTN
jgi:plasmid stabilization system protein ParE